MATLFVRAANPIWYFVDLAGVQLNDQYYAFFLENVAPYDFQAIYHDNQHTTPWSNPLQFHPNGTLPDNMYFDPSAVYRIEIRKGPTQTDPLIYEINDFVPGVTDSGVVTEFVGEQNILVNPQFADIDFVSPLNITTAGTYDIAPAWKLILVGAGTTTVTKSLTSGQDSNTNSTPGNPPSYLTFNNNGWTSATLQQTLPKNGAIFARGSMAFYMLAFATTTPTTITPFYVPSQGSSTSFGVQSIPTGVFVARSSIRDIPVSTNTLTGDAAFVNFNLVLPGTGIVSLTNLQLLGQEIVHTSTAAPVFHETTYPEQVNQEFYIYKDSILTQPKDNILVGWTFALNPYQFSPTALTTITNQCQYIADQTILYQETASSLIASKAASNLNFGLQLQAINGVNANRFAIIQYIDSSTIKPYWGQTLSQMVRAVWGHAAGALPAPEMKMRLIWRTTAIPTIGAAEPITGFDANGDPIFSAGWTAIKPLNDVNYTMTNLGTLANSNEFPEMAYNQMDLPVGASNPLYLGVVVYINKPLNNTVGNVDYVVFDRISLVPNDYAIDASPETYDETLRKCQFYYEKSYDAKDLPATHTINSQLVFDQIGFNSGANTTFYPNAFTIVYKTVKRGSPSNFNTYTPDLGVLNNITSVVLAGFTSTALAYSIANYTAFGVGGLGVQAITFTPVASPSAGATTATVTNPPGAYMALHYTVNACLGNPTLP